MNIFLVGFMGVGKTTLGKKIANRMNLKFIDLDSELEQQEKKSIEQIFEENGENYFREMETKWLTHFNRQDTLVATGGGTACFKNNLQVMQQKGITIYLKSSPENLANRLFEAKTSRPLIKKFKDDKTGLLQFVTSKLNERLPYYEKCDLTFEVINTDAKKLEELVLALNIKFKQRTG